LPARRDRATKLLSFIGDLVVNGNPLVGLKPWSANDQRRAAPPIGPPTDYNRARVPEAARHRTPKVPPGTRDRLLELGPQRFPTESPWDRLARLRELVPNILFQMLLRAASAVGYTNYPDNVVKAFVKESAKAGIDVFRIFDALNFVPNLRLAVDAVRQTGAI